MPWTKDDASRFKEGLSDEDQKKWAEIANKALKQCVDNGGKQDECEQKAIRIANSQVTANEEDLDVFSLRHNMSNLVQECELEGRKYLVAPTVMIVEGVLNNAYYPADEIADCPEDWNGRPVLVDHSTTDEGMPKTANEPEEREKRTVGWVFHAHYENGKLKAEAWIDEEKCKQVEGGETVLQKLEDNEGIEVSTGLRAKHLQQNGEFSGKEYNWIAMQFRADHLALLPNSKGACSWEDGAGAPRLNQAHNQDEDNSMDDIDKAIKALESESVWERVANGIAEKLGLKLNKENNGMDREAVIKELIDNEKFGEQDVESLRALSDEALSSLQENTQAESEPASEPEPEPEPSAKETQNEDQVTTLDEYIQKCPDAEMREFLYSSVQNRRQEKAQLVQNLVANERCKFTEDQLKEKSLDELKMLEEMASVPDYSGKAGTSTVTEHEDKDAGREDLPNMPSLQSELKV